MRMKKTFCVLFFLLGFSMIGLIACSQNDSNSQKEVNYADDIATATIATGWEKRGDCLMSHKDEQDSAAILKEAVQIEIDNDSSLKTAQFKDSKLQQTVLAYLNSLDDQMDVLESYPYGSADYARAWSAALDNRTIILKQLVDDYGLTVSEKYKNEFDQLIANGSLASNKESIENALNSMLNSAVWKKTDNGGGRFQYSAVIENTSDYNFKSISILVNLFDADDVKHEAHATAKSWKKGEKIEFEVRGSDVDAQSIDAMVERYIADS